jgi:hypothetical protein
VGGDRVVVGHGFSGAGRRVGGGQDGRELAGHDLLLRADLATLVEVTAT